MKRLALLLLVLLTTRPALAAPDIHAYIRGAWHSLSRSVTSCEAYRDVKVGTAPVLYLPAGMAVPADVAALARTCHVRVLHLPRAIGRLGDVQPSELKAQGLLYLPNPYVVPGGMFNEMYGWDSYFIMLGLLDDGDTTLARGMLENQFFEIEHYGAVLNANRSYYLTRSQPPFLTSAIRAVYDALPGKLDSAWLSRAYDAAVKDHQMWTTAPHLAGDTGLSRYWDTGQGPVPEQRQHNTYYEEVAGWVLAHPGVADYVRFVDRPAQVTGHAMTMVVQHGPDRSAPRLMTLTPDYYKGDRAMRASGFDVSFRFGPFSGATHHYAPVCLNSLLYKEETDLAWLAARLGRTADAQRWQEAAQQRRVLVDRYLWNPQAGLYFDYDAVAGRQSTYHYATTFYPLWAGLASPEQAAAVVSHLDLFEQPHGLAMSDVESGAQWDKPFGWAPVHLLAVEGMHAYHFDTQASRIASKFRQTVEAAFEREKTIREKYDVVTGATTTRIGIGYKQNVLGFGWTNGVYLELERVLKAAATGR